jgi:hypothetical protein
MTLLSNIKIKNGILRTFPYYRNFIKTEYGFSAVARMLNEVEIEAVANTIQI